MLNLRYHVCVITMADVYSLFQVRLSVDQFSYRSGEWLILKHCFMCVLVQQFESMCVDILAVLLITKETTSNFC